MPFLLACVHTIDRYRTSARLIQVLDATGCKHLRWIRLTSVLRINLVSGREGALRLGEGSSGGTDGRKLRGATAKIWKRLFDLADAIAQLELLVILEVKSLFGYARSVLKESFCESVVLSLDSFVFLSADGNVERPWTDTRRVSLLQLLVGGGAMHGRPFSLTYIDQFVEQDGIFAVQIYVFL